MTLHANRLHPSYHYVYKIFTEFKALIGYKSFKCTPLDKLIQRSKILNFFETYFSYILMVRVETCCTHDVLIDEGVFEKCSEKLRVTLYGFGYNCHFE